MHETMIYHLIIVLPLRKIGEHDEIKKIYNNIGERLDMVIADQESLVDFESDKETTSVKFFFRFLNTSRLM